MFHVYHGEHTAHEGLPDRYFKWYHYPVFPASMIMPSESEENRVEFEYLQFAWKTLFLHGGCSKHVNFLVWCVNRMLQNGAELTVRRFSDHYSNDRLSLHFLWNQTANSYFVVYTCQYKGTIIDWRQPSLQPRDFQLRIHPGVDHAGDMIKADSSVLQKIHDVEHDLYYDVPFDDEKDSKCPFSHKLRDQVIWLHRLCQMFPGMVSMGMKKIYADWSPGEFFLYGVLLNEDGTLSLIGKSWEAIWRENYRAQSLEARTVSADTVFYLPPPCLDSLRFDKKYEGVSSP